MFKQIAKTIERKIKIKTYPRAIETILIAIKKFSDVWLIIRYSKQPIRVVHQALKIFENQGLIKINKKIELTKKGEQILKQLDANFNPDVVCKICQGRGINYKFDEKLYKKFLEIQEKRPKPLEEYAQGYVTPETTIARVLFTDYCGDLQGREIISLGLEDDLTGLALALTKKPKRVVVLDIDQRLIDFDNYWSKKLNLNLKAEVFDLRKKLPKRFIGKFDVFFSDPSETVYAIYGFILKGAACLKEAGSTGYFGFTLQDASLFKWLKLQKILNQNGLVITHILPDFNLYTDEEDYFQDTRAFKESPVQIEPDKIWYTSSLFRVVALPNFKRVNLDLTKIGEKLYDDEENASD